MNRLIEKTVFSGFNTAWRLATWPTRTPPPLPMPTTEGVSRLPSSLMMILGSPPSITATTEFVVPRSIPMIFAIFPFSFLPDSGSVPFQPLRYESRKQMAVHRLCDLPQPAHLHRPHPLRLAVLSGQSEGRDPRRE